MEDTMTNSIQFLGSNKYGIFALTLASAFSVNVLAKESVDVNSADSSNLIRTELNFTETFSIDNTYSFSAKKNFRDRYKRIAQSDWFKKTHSGMSVGEVMTIEE